MGQSRTTSPFIDALTKADLDGIRRCPKADLHNHAYLGGCRKYLLGRTGHDIAPLDHKRGSMDEMHAWVAAHIKPLLKGGKGRRLAFEAALVLARDDGVTRIEFGDDLSANPGGLADHGIRLNVCPTSNVLLGRVESIATHPIRRLYDAGVKVTVNTDDALVFGRSVSEEFLELYRAGVFSAAELDIVRRNGLNDE
jgi:hypothetical protein